MSQFAEILERINGPFALAGLALLLCGWAITQFGAKGADGKTKRQVALALVGLGGLTVVGCLIVAIMGQAVQSPDVRVNATASGTESKASASGRDMIISDAPPPARPGDTGDGEHAPVVDVEVEASGNKAEAKAAGRDMNIGRPAAKRSLVLEQDTQGE